MRHSRLQPQTMHSRFQASMRYIWRYKYLYLLLLPAVLYFLIFHYLPMYGVIISFKDFNFKKGILGSEWIGLENFEYMFGLNDFYRVFWNSFCLSFLRLVFEFPIPIILALLLNEIGGKRFKKITQTAIYLPHFLSWAVIGGILVNFLSPTWGVVNQIIQQLGFDPIFFLGDPKYFRTTAVISSIWKEAGWGTIIYIAALSGVDMEQHEAAVLDGATRFQRVIYLTLPAISGTIVTVFILNLAKVLNLFDPVWVLQNSMVINTSDVLETYVYRMGISGSQYGLSTAAGLFKSVISILLVAIGNKLSKKLTGEEVL